MLRVAKNRMSTILVLCFLVIVLGIKELITSHFMTSQTQFCDLIGDKKIFYRDFLYYICSYRLGNLIGNVTGTSGTIVTRGDWL